MMRIGKLLSTAMLKWLFFFCYFGCVGATMSVYAQGGEKAPMGGAGMNVIDPAAPIQPGSFIAISEVVDGKRWYLGVDTLAAADGNYKVKAYEHVNYACIWWVGPLYNPRAKSTSDVLNPKNYHRYLKSQWIDTEITAADKKAWLTMGAPHGSYSDIAFAEDTIGVANPAVRWVTQKDETEPGRFVMGRLYTETDQAGIEVQGWVRYDGLYGYSRLAASRPDIPQRLTRWTYSEGTKMHCLFTPAQHTFGLNFNDVDTLPFTLRMSLELGGKRYKSRYDNVIVYAQVPDIINNQQTLHDTYHVRARLDWASSKDEPGKKIYSLFETRYFDEVEGVYKTRDSIMMMVDTTHITPHPEFNNYTDTIYAIGPSPCDLPDKDGNYRNHEDYLHIHMFYSPTPGDTLEFIDSARVTRRMFRKEKILTLQGSFDPSDYTFAYFDDGTPVAERYNTIDFEFAATYKSGTHYRRIDGTVAQTVIDESEPVMINSLRSRTDGEGHLLDTLLVAAYEADGVTPCSWIQSVTLTAKNTIRVTVKPRTSTAGYLTGMLKCHYTYFHTGDTARADNVIWLLHAPMGATSGLISFAHQAGASGAPQDASAFDRQQVPEITMTYYHIPDTANPLPIHHDHWGYYRWFIYGRSTAERGKDISAHWQWVKTPQTEGGTEFYQINGVTSPYSRGRFEMAPRIANNTGYIKSEIPDVQYKSGATASTYVDTLACDVSAYLDTTSTGRPDLGNMTSLVEPTLSYRQIFAMRPAKESADKMATCRIGGNWMQKDTLLVPSGRTFRLHTNSAYKLSTDGKTAGVGSLQYVYYCNPNSSDNPSYAGTRTGISDASLNQGVYYNRIGLPHTFNRRIRLQLLTFSELTKISGSTTVILVNPRHETGYIIGKPSDSKMPMQTDFPDCSNIIDLQTALETKLNTPGSNYDGYYLTLTRRGSNFTFEKGDDYNDYKLYNLFTVTGEGDRGWNIRFYGWGASGSSDFTVSAYDGYKTQLPSGADASLIRLKSEASDWKFGSNKGYLSGGTLSNYGHDSNYRVCIKNENTENQAWLVFKVIEEDEGTFQEHAKWYRRVQSGGGWTPWKEANTTGANSWTADESNIFGGCEIRTSYGGAENSIVEYKLQSEHFQLAYFTVYMRDPAKTGPSTTAILTEDQIDRDYEVLASIGLDQLPTPGTTNVVTPYAPYHSFRTTEFGYHYPVGDETNQLPAAKRVFSGDMPAKGEYCVINKFVDPAGVADDVECMSGASHGYMYCFNRAIKPLKFIDFYYDQPGCTDQDMVLVANICCPTNSTTFPQITAEYYGKTKSGVWHKLTTFVSGNITEVGQWYQVKLDLPKQWINDHVQFRCVGTVSGTEGDAFLLFDRFRLLAKNRVMTTFQGRSTCVDNDTHKFVYLISRIDYRAHGQEAGSVIAYQYQKWDATANDGAGGYVPMKVSQDHGEGANPRYTRLDSAHTEVYPGYYKIGMSAEASVTNATLKSRETNADYGTIVVPEASYRPDLSNTTAGKSTKRDSVLQYLQGKGLTIASEHLDERARIRSLEWININETYSLGTFEDPMTKFYVNEGTTENPNWIMYLINRVPVDATDNGTFRILMTKLDHADSKPLFKDEGCATSRIIEVKGSVTMEVEGNNSWPNYSRTELDGSDAAHMPLPANSAHKINLIYNVDPSLAKEGTLSEANARFDLLRSFAFMGGYMNMNDEERAAADAQWEEIYHCTPGEFQEAMNAFRSDNPNNPNRTQYNWARVTRNSFYNWEGSPTEADGKRFYDLINRLVVNERLLEIGLSEREIYLAANQDLYYYVRPITYSGTYVSKLKCVDGVTDSIITNATICNTPLWLELHSGPSIDSLRFGYDRKFGDAYAIPIIRATREEANGLNGKKLQVRIAAMSHNLETNDGITIGWDSTQVVDSNDPEWIARMKTVDNKPRFRYAQDRILQSAPYSKYYKQGDTILFTPVNNDHIGALQAHDCDCYNYDPNGTTVDAAHPRAAGAAGTNVYIQPATPEQACNAWHVKDRESYHPGYQLANNITLKAGYWYKFKTYFFHKPNHVLSYNASAGSSVGESFFILAIAPDTAIWAPSDPGAANYWNNDDNWQAIVNGAPRTDAIAKVPLAETNVIIPQSGTGMMPIVNDQVVTLSDTLDFGYKRHSCKQILFRPRSQMLGQERLEYEKAFVDVIVPTDEYMTFSPALDYIYAGDMYVPNRADNVDFDPKEFKDPGTDYSADYNRSKPYSIYSAYYNTSVPYAYQNLDVGGTELGYRTRSSADWVWTNTMNIPFTPGNACLLLAYDESDPNAEELTIRLPKKETYYYYVTKKKDGTYVQGSQETMDGKPSFAELNNNLAYDKYKLDGGEGITYHLTNATASKVFFFGNPTMSLIDVWELCNDNKDSIENAEVAGSYYFTAYNLRQGESSYTPQRITGPGEFYIAPMRSVGLIAKTPRKKLDVLLEPDALVALTADGGEIVSHDLSHTSEPSPAPRRQKASEVQTNDKWLYITAKNETNYGEYKAYITFGEASYASAEVRPGEDIQSLASGMTDNAFETPLTAYTIADNQPVMLDMRDTLKNMPLIFGRLDNAGYEYNDITYLSFSLKGNWDKPLYIYDIATGDSVQICNGLQLGIRTPESDQIRYFINGGKYTTTTNDDQPGVTTDIDEVNDQLPNTNYQSGTVIYDVLGRKIMTLGEYDLLSTIQLPTGVYIIQRGKNTERMVIR